MGSSGERMSVPVVPAGMLIKAKQMGGKGHRATEKLSLEQIHLLLCRGLVTAQKHWSA